MSTIQDTQNEKPSAQYSRVDVMIPSKAKGIHLHAWKYLPQNYTEGKKLPVVVGGVSSANVEE